MTSFSVFTGHQFFHPAPPNDSRRRRASEINPGPLSRRRRTTDYQETGNPTLQTPPNTPSTPSTPSPTTSSSTSARSASASSPSPSSSTAPSSGTSRNTRRASRQRPSGRSTQREGSNRAITFYSNDSDDDFVESPPF